MFIYYNSSGVFVTCSPSQEAQQNDSVAHCVVLTPNIRNLLEGEAFYYVPSFMADVKATEDQFTWRRNNVVVSSNESERIHVHGLAIYLLNVTPADAAIYTFQYTRSPEKCYTADLTVNVFDESFRLEKVMCYGSVESPSQSTSFKCPDPVWKTCQDTSGVITWYKNMGLIEHEHKQDIRVQKLPQNNGVYTCMCTWAHNHRLYNSSGSRLLTLKDLSINSLEFLSPSDTNKEQFADAGSPTSLNCSVFCGINTGKHCTAEWRVNGSRVDNGKDYVQDNSIVNTPHNNTMATAILTIRKVSAKDFQTNFTCVAKNNFKIQSKYLTLKPRESIIPVVTGYLFMLLLCIAVAILIKLFLVDLVLFFRPYFLCRSSKDVTKVYDAYVIYQSQSETKDIEYLLSEFISRSLPSVLEAQCGYKLFIQGRDDTPGEDRLELVEKRMKCSRRLMIILTPASSFSSTDCELASARELAFAGFDWQVGIHHVLVQREMSVILVQLGDTDQEYSHLPAGLQHLIRKSTPIKWPEKLKNASKANSRFWKKVRYLMPARPVANHLRLAPI
ncbi:interleukin-1 receptor-like 1 [Synchiropus splendidus]|uniref:interleukin-1 receptor-like 1 n=1 Tax=Synchiropus splendidus TaxID=270530 RepID=UPI00237E46EF|nr:interleukin-1 receptor-like 1 [Synchiropus splendidus]